MGFRLLPPRSRLGWTPYGWLIYVSFYIVSMWTDRDSPSRLAIELAALGIFLILYFLGYWVEGTRKLLIVAGLVGLGAALIPINPGSMCFFIYGAAFLGGVGYPAVAYRWLALLVTCILVQAWLMQFPPYLWGPAVLLSGIVGASNIHFIHQERLDAKLRLAQEEIERLAKVEERERIARDVHDILGHTLSVIVLKSELASRLFDAEPGRASAEIRDVERISRGALAEVRRAVQGYRVTRFREELAGARLALETAGVEMIAEVAPVDLSSCDESALAMTLREAVTNVLRHARARRCFVTLGAADGRVTLEVRDDGVGGEIREGAGLGGMRSRLAEAGGTLSRDGSSGMQLTASLPYPMRTVRRDPAAGAAS